MEPFDASDLAGVWSPVAHARGARLARQLDVLAGEVDGVVSLPSGERAARELVDACTSRALPLLLATDRRSAAQRAGLEPGALLVDVPARDVASLSRALGSLARDADPVGLVLDLRRGPTLGPDALVELARAAPGLIGLLLPSADEECCLALQAFEGQVAVWVPGPEHASGHRYGAAGALSLVACLSPVGAGGWCELLDDDLALALAFERRLQKFWEGTLLPLAARLGWGEDVLAHALVAAGGWADVGPHDAIPPATQRALADAARELVPELF